MEEKDPQKDNIEVTCPSCGDKSIRNKKILAICAYGCRECGFVGMSIYMKAEQEKKKNLN